VTEQDATPVALITGAARGIGYAAAQRLAAGGWFVALADLDADAVGAAAERLRTAGRETLGLTVDVSDSAAADAAVARVLGEYGRLDALVNNAGLLRDRPLLDMTDADFRTVIDVSLFGSFAMSRAAARPMVDQHYGRIVNIASRAYLGNPGQANYSAAKAGVVGLTKALAKELGRHEITVNAIAPGMVATEMVTSHPKADAIIERAANANSVPRIGDVSDIAAAIEYLCSRDAGYITGDVLHLTGGRFG
jgi:3-oxoacyl-[acyl-carrier protein] reductase